VACDSCVAPFVTQDIEEAVAFMDTVPMTDVDRKKIYEQNATRLLKL